LKRTFAGGVEANSLGLALKGRPVNPFYIVDRQGGQAVVSRSQWFFSTLQFFRERGGS
jgi:hypothetical protein